MAIKIYDDRQARIVRPVLGGKAVLAPSVLSADFSRLGEEIRAVESAGAGWIHLDVMDGHFVPNLTFGPPVVGKLRGVSQAPFDCHLMVEYPERWVDPFASAGADIITVHAEASVHLDRLLNQIRGVGCLAGVSINPATPVSAIEPVLDFVDLVLVMSVNPGFGGQKYLPYCGDKVAELVRVRGSRKYLIEIDGGVDLSNISDLRGKGVDVFVAGSAVYGQGDVGRAVGDLLNLIEK